MAVISALLGTTLAIRSINQQSVLTAANKAGGPLFGASASDRGWLARSNAEFGHLPIISSHYSGLPATNAWTTGADGFNHSAVVVSFEARPSRVLSGADDAALSHFFDTAPTGHAIYYSYYREPEANVLAHQFTVSKYKAAWAHIVTLASHAHNGDLKSTLMLSAGDLDLHSDVRWKDYLPGGRIISTLAWDAYPAGTLSNNHPRLTSPARFMGPAVAASKSVGMPFGFAAFALSTAKGRPRWLKEVANYLMSRGALFGLLFNSPRYPTMELTDSASIAAWRSVVARSGTDDPLPLGPTPTPIPTTPTPGHGPATGTLVCGQPVLDSPFTYDGAAGSYSSGTSGLPTYGTPGSDFPNDTAGHVLAAGTADYQSWQLNANTVYYLLPGVHIGSFQANKDDAFVGGFSNGTPTILSGNYSQSEHWAIDSNSSNGDQPGVTIEYLTIEKYTPDGDAGAINQDANTGWTIQYNTVTLNVPGAGAILGTNNVLKNNCMTLNGQYGFQSTTVDSGGDDSLTTGPYNVNIEDNEISYNDTCDFSGTLDNKAIGWSNHNPVPAQDQNPNCGTVNGDGNEGGFKLWRTNGVTIKGNYIHNNWGPGGWADTDNANTAWTGNTITDNENAAIVEEVSYNFSITNNYMAGNDWTDGLGNPGFPQPAIYISESGSDTAFGGVPACPEASCSDQGSYPNRSVISGNTLVDNGGNIFLWQNSNRYCSDGFDGPCTLVDGSASPFTVSACDANLPSARISTTTYAGEVTGTPAEDWWDGCMWKTENVDISNNVIDFNPANVTDCNQTDWPDCGAGGVFSEYGSPPDNGPGWVVPTDITFFQHNSWSDNTYNGPSTFFAWNQGSEDNPVTWADWTGSVSSSDKCESPGEQQSGSCTGPFGQDAGSTYNSAPLSTNP